MVRTETSLNQVIEDVLAYLGQRIRIKSAYLFGSYATETPREYSDIDLAVFYEGSLDFEEKASLAAQVKLHCAQDVELHLFPAKALEEARPTNFYGYLIENGKAVYGAV